MPYCRLRKPHAFSFTVRVRAPDGQSYADVVNTSACSHKNKDVRMGDHWRATLGSLSTGHPPNARSFGER
jgi:hypothetical protein